MSANSKLDAVCAEIASLPDSEGKNPSNFDPFKHLLHHHDQIDVEKFFLTMAAFYRLQKPTMPELELLEAAGKQCIAYLKGRVYTAVTEPAEGSDPFDPMDSMRLFDKLIDVFEQMGIIDESTAVYVKADLLRFLRSLKDSGAQPGPSSKHKGKGTPVSWIKDAKGQPTRLQLPSGSVEHDKLPENIYEYLRPSATLHHSPPPSNTVTLSVELDAAVVEFVSYEPRGEPLSLPDLLLTAFNGLLREHDTQHDTKVIEELFLNMVSTYGSQAPVSREVFVHHMAKMCTTCLTMTVTRNASQDSSFDPMDSMRLYDKFFDVYQRQNILDEAMVGRMKAGVLKVLSTLKEGTQPSPSDVDRKGKGTPKDSTGVASMPRMPTGSVPHIKIVQPDKAGQAGEGYPTVVFTNVPPYDDDPDGNTVWITTPEIKARVLKRGIPRPIGKLGTPSFVVKEASNMGLGVFATRDIKCFDIVLSERPLLISPANQTSALYEIDAVKAKDLTPSQLFQVSAAGAERVLEVALVRMSNADRRKFDSLANSHREDGSPPLFGIVRTNGFGIEFRDPEADKERGYGAVTAIGSRFNHSCTPNVEYTFDPETFAMRFAATRDIEAGEQLFVTYVEMDKTKAERLEKLKPYGIYECHCHACVNATPQSDKLRKLLPTMIYNWEKQAHMVWAKDPKLTIRVLDPIFAVKKKMEDDGYYSGAFYVRIHQVIAKVYQIMGMKKEAAEMEALRRKLARRIGLK